MDDALLGRLSQDVITLFVVLDPVGSVPIFLHATARLTSAERTKVALVSELVALLVLMLFLFGGQYVLEAMHVSIPAFQLAGAAVLFIFALQMIFGGHHSGGDAEATRSATEVAIFPMAMPGIASPGALLAVVLLTDNRRVSLAEESLIAGLTLAVLLCVLMALLLATRIQRLLGAAGIMVVTQVMGLVLAAFSVQQMLDGVTAAFGLGAH